MADATRIPELLMPAGGFDSAIAAIEGGADALYLGFRDFSARRQARNFDRLEYRRLRRLASERGLRLYVALNTVILEGELEGAASLLAFLGRFPPDAILVQDWGLARMVRERHPGIAIHASTQAAVQGPEALELARGMGISRVVLPRETSLAEIAALRDSAPGMELEAFVHGALCYSFSGLCLASGVVLGRSGNRGECAQLCRSYYEAAPAPGPSSEGRFRGRGYWFSCRDLDLAERLSELVDAGISSLKVEGRMKSPEYCHAVARLYRGHLDRLSGAGPSDEEMGLRLEAARVAFSRSPTEGWALERGGRALIDAEYPGHRGAPAGRIVSSGPETAVIDLESAIGLRDGLLAFEGGDRSLPASFPVTGLRDAKTGRELRTARSGSRVEIDAPARLRPGDEVRKVSSREMDRKAPSVEEYEPDRSRVPARLVVEGRRLSLEISLPRFDGVPGPGARALVEGGEELPFERGRSPGGFERAAALFSAAGEADFVLEPDLSGSKVEVQTPSGIEEIALADAFLPPSVLKRERNRARENVAELLASAEADYAADSLLPRDGAGGRPLEGLSRRAPGRVIAPPRSMLTFPIEGLPSGLAFASPRVLAEGRPLPEFGGRAWLPLAPLVADRGAYASAAEARTRSELESRELSVGLGAVHHLAFARSLASRHTEEARSGRLRFFIDFNLYVANHLALRGLDEAAGGVDFAYFYLEGGERDRLAAELAAGEGGPALAPCGEGFEPPLFQSLACFFKHNVASGACPRDCPRSWSGVASDRGRSYRIVVDDCVTSVYRIPK